MAKQVTSDFRLTSHDSCVVENLRAKRGTKFSLLDEKMNQQKNLDPMSATKRFEHGNAAHLFLGYAVDSSVVKVDEMKSTPNPCIIKKAHRRVSSWGSSFDDFELECDLFLQTNQKLSQDRSSAVSRVLKKVAQETSRDDYLGSHSGHRNARFANYLQDALEDRSVDDTVISYVSYEQDSDPAKNEMESLREQIRRQQEEIKFLRSTVKALLHSDNTEGDRREPNPCLRQCSETKSSPSPTEFVKEVDIGIPRDILVHHDIASDGTDALSDVTLNESSIGIDLFDNANVIVGSASPRSIALPKPNKALTASNAYRSFPDMARGEIQNKRARGMLFTISFKSWGFTLQGRYIGMLRHGIPNGSGILRFDNGDYYVGGLKNGLLHGDGSLFLRRDGQLLKFRGKFEQNEFIGWKWPKQAMDPLKAIAKASHQSIIC